MLVKKISVHQYIKGDDYETRRNYEEITKENTMMYEDITNDLRRKEYEIRWYNEGITNEKQRIWKKPNTKELLTKAHEGLREFFINYYHYQVNGLWITGVAPPRLGKNNFSNIWAILKIFFAREPFSLFAILLPTFLCLEFFRWHGVNFLTISIRFSDGHTNYSEYNGKMLQCPYNFAH